MISHHITAQLAREHQRDLLRTATSRRAEGRDETSAVSSMVSMARFSSRSLAAAATSDRQGVEPLDGEAITSDGGERDAVARPALRRSPTAASHPREHHRTHVR